MRDGPRQAVRGNRTNICSHLETCTPMSYDMSHEGLD